MVHKKNIVRDIVFVFILAFLVRSISSRKIESTVTPPQTPETAQPQVEEPQIEKVYETQKDDYSDDDQSSPIKQYIEILKQHSIRLLGKVMSYRQTGNPLLLSNLNQIIEQIKDLEKQYQQLMRKTSKTNMFMGPFGAAATALKELSIEKQIKEIALKMKVIAADLIHDKKMNIQIQDHKNIDDILQHNDDLIQIL